MSSRPVAFAVGLVVLFGAATLVGAAVPPIDDPEVAHDAHQEAADGGHSAHGSGGAAGEASELGGLAIAEGGYRLDLDETIVADASGELSFRVLDRHGESVTEFDRLHARRLHLIVVREDGTGFQHLHPKLDADGTWRVPLRLRAPGPYRVYADFSVGGSRHTLASSLLAPGVFRPRPFRPPSTVASTGPYRVELKSDAAPAGDETALTFAVEANGEPVRELEPYLGARGHLVALREGDLAYLHVHPREASASQPGNEVTFDALFPTPGRYQLYLQVKEGGAVRTTQFAIEVPR